MRCHLGWNGIWILSYFPKSICKLDKAFHWWLLSSGFTRRALNISITRRVYILMDITDLMSLKSFLASHESIWGMIGLTCHWQYGPRVDYSMWQFCWALFSTPCSRWNDGTSKQHNAKDMGFWRSIPSLKKGVGHGLHKSDILCSTVGWLEEAIQTLEYKKNYEWYWTRELAVH